MPSVWKNLYSIQGIKHRFLLELQIYLQIFFVFIISFHFLFHYGFLAAMKQFRTTQMVDSEGEKKGLMIEH